MGWGIKIPEIGLDTGEFIGGDIGKGLTNISREMNTPLGRYFTGGMLGLVTKPGMFSFQGQKDAPADFGQLTNKWNSLTEGFTKEGVPSAINAAQQNTTMGKQNALSTLGQFGGQGVGASSRLDRQGKWGMFGNMADAQSQGELSKAQSQLQGILGLEVPIAIGKDQAAAQAAAARAQSGASGLGLIGTIGGATLGGIFGGPGGAAIGGSVGGALGQNIGRRF